MSVIEQDFGAANRPRGIDQIFHFMGEHYRLRSRENGDGECIGIELTIRSGDTKTQACLNKYAGDVNNSLYWGVGFSDLIDGSGFDAGNRRHAVIGADIKTAGTVLDAALQILQRRYDTPVSREARPSAVLSPFSVFDGGRA